MPLPDRAACPTHLTAAPQVYFKLLFYGLAFESTGPVIHMVFMITMAIRSWVLLLFLSIVGFGSSLLVLYQRVRALV